MQAAISVRDVTKVYVEGSNQIPVLHGVDFDVEQGEVVLLMGPSGSGKTTLLSIMGCILRATSGSVQVAGREGANLPERELPGVRLKNIGFIFQGFNLFPTLTVGENVELALDLKGIRGAKAKGESRRLLEQVGLAEKYDAFPSDLSGGQKQRVAVARGLSGSPGGVLGGGIAGGDRGGRADGGTGFAFGAQRDGDDARPGAQAWSRSGGSNA